MPGNRDAHISSVDMLRCSALPSGLRPLAV